MAKPQEIRGAGLAAGPVTLDQAGSLPFCQATIAEIQRCSRVGVSNIMHRLTRPATLPTGHKLPQDCIVQARNNFVNYL